MEQSAGCRWLGLLLRGRQGECSVITSTTSSVETAIPTSQGSAPFCYLQWKRGLLAFSSQPMPPERHFLQPRPSGALFTSSFMSFRIWSRAW